MTGRTGRNLPAATPRTRSGLRRWLRRTLTAVALLVATAGLLYALRWPLLTRRITGLAERELGRLLSARVTVGQVRGPLLTGIELRDIRIDPDPESPLAGPARVDRLRIDYAPRFLLSASPGRVSLVEISGTALALRPGQGQSPDGLAAALQGLLAAMPESGGWPEVRLLDTAVSSEGLAVNGLSATLDSEVSPEGGRIRLNVASAGLAVHGLDLGSVSGQARLRWPAERRLATLEVEVEATGGAAEGSLRAELPLVGNRPSARSAIDVSLRTSDLPALFSAPKWLDADLGRLFRSAELHLAARGSPADLRGSGWLRFSPDVAAAPAAGWGVGPGSGAGQGQVPIACAGGVLTLGPAEIPTAMGLLRAGGSLPLHLALDPAPPGTAAEREADLHASVESESLEVLAHHLPGQLRAMNPQARILLTGRLRGTPRRPQAFLEAVFSQGRLRLPAPLTELTAVEIAARLDNRELTVQSASGRMEHGRISAAGSLSLQGAGDFAFGLKGTGLLLLDGRDGARLRLDADLGLSGRPGAAVLSGKLGVRSAGFHREFAGAAKGKDEPGMLDRDNVLRPLAIDLPYAARGGLELPGLPGADWLKLDVTAAATGEVLVENSVLGALLAGRLRFGGTAAAPALSGEVRTLSGEIRPFPGMLLRIGRGRVRIPDTPGTEAQLDFQSEVEVGRVRIFIAVSGPLSAPVLRLTSSPPYAQEDLVALLAYGRPPGSTGSLPAGDAALSQAGRLVSGMVLDRPPSARPREDLLARLTVGYGLESQAPIGSVLRQHAARENVIRAQFALSDYLAIVSSQDGRGGVNGDLQLRLRWPRPRRRSGPRAAGQDGKTDAEAQRPEATAATEFSGNRTHSSARLMAIIRPDLDRLGNSGWSAAAASDAAHRILRFLLDQGHCHAEVRADLDGGAARFLVEEGPLVRTGTIGFAGNRRMPPDRLRRALYRDWPRLGRTPFTAKLLAAQVQSLEAFYREEGYLLVRVLDPVTEYDAARRRMNVTHRIEESTRFRLAGLDWRGADAGDAAALAQLTRGYIGGPLRASLPGRLAALVRDYYRERGHAEVRVQIAPALDPAARRERLAVSIEPGPRVRLEAVKVRGTRSSSPDFVRRVAGLREGQLLTPSAIGRAERRLMDTGAFKSLFSEIGPRDGDAEDRPAERTAGLTLSMTEVEPLETTLRVGYGSFDRLRLGAELGLRNLLGQAEVLTVGGSWSERGHQLYADAAVPPWPGLPLTAHGQAFYEEREDISFSGRNYGVSPYLSLRLSRYDRLNAGVIFEWIETEDAPPGEPPGTLRDFRLTSGFVSLSFDRRDSPVLARRGLLVTARFAAADRDLSSDISFTQVSGTIGGYLPLADWLTAAVSLQGGMIRPFGRTETVPIAMRYFGGGAGTVRGFEERTLGPVLGDDPVGGEVLLAAQTELRLRLWRGLHAAVFFDAGNVYARADDVDLDDLRWGVGPGLRYHTPAGALGLDLGFNPDRRPGEEPAVLHLSLGLPF